MDWRCRYFGHKIREPFDMDAPRAEFVVCARCGMDEQYDPDFWMSGLAVLWLKDNWLKLARVWLKFRFGKWL